jgi:predicted transcriptional regulator of viral defense system
MTLALPIEFDRAQAAEIGLSWRALDDLLAQGQITKITRGHYRRTDAASADTDLLEISLRSPRATIALTSALARHGLIDEIPSRIDIALPRGAHRPELAAPVDLHLFDWATFDIGREQMPIVGTDRTIAIYSAERSIADAFRMRRTVGFELPTEALKNWLRRGSSKPGQLMALAMKLPGGSGPLREALGYLT